jgi:hypothetical protein
VPILKTADEMAEDTQRILDGKEPTQESENTVEDVPQAFKDHVEKYAVKIQTVNKTRLPYYIQNNLKYVDATTSLLKSITVGEDTYVIKDLLNECKRIETENGAVYVHPSHGKQEYQENIQMAKWRANDFGEQIILLPKANAGFSADSYNLTRKVLEEFKTNQKETISAIDNALRKGAKQADHIILKIDSDIRVGDFTNALTDRISRCKGFKELRIRIGDCEAVYTREEILRDGFKIKPEDFHIGQSLRSRGVQLSPNTATKLDNFFGTSKKTPKEIAEIRHSARTADEIKGIQQAWNKSRVESLKTALNDGLLPKGCTAKLEELLKLNTSGNFAAFQKEIKPLQKAVARHTARTQKQAEELKARWDKRVFDNAKTRRDANRVLTLAKSYSEVDYAQLEALVAGNDLAAMETETKKVLQALKDMRAEERALQDLIPDVHEWHKKFTLEELKEAHKKVVDTMAYYKTKFDADLAAGTNLEKLKDQLLDKIKYVENPGAIHPGAIPAKTWQAQQNAYIKMLAKTEQKIKLEALNAEYKVLLSFKTTSKAYNEYLPKIKAALDSGDEKKAEWLMGGAKTRKIMLERARKGKTSMRSVAANFDAADYTEKAKKNAIWCKTAKESHKNWDADSEAAWKGATSGERKGWRDYTGGSGHMNRPLRGYDKNLSPNASAWSKKNFVGVGNVDLDIEGGEANIRNLYNLLERCTFDTNRWLQRGLETWDGFEGFLGFSKPGQSVTREQVRAMVGKEVTDYAFMSCGSAKGTGFSGVILNIYCPKGTKGVYACPHSCFGDGENETILQLGTKFRITKVECPDRGNVYIDLEVIGYEKHPSL